MKHRKGDHSLEIAVVLRSFSCRTKREKKRSKREERRKQSEGRERRKCDQDFLDLTNNNMILGNFTEVSTTRRKCGRSIKAVGSDGALEAAIAWDDVSSFFLRSPSFLFVSQDVRFEEEKIRPSTRPT